VKLGLLIKVMKIRSGYLKEVLRNVYDQIKVNGEWWYRYKHELYQIFKEPEIIQAIKSTRFVWLGHPLTAYQLYPCRKLAFINPHVTRNVGWLAVRWIDSDEEDGKKVELTNGKPRQLTEWSGVASLWRSWLGWGCSTSMNKWIGRYTAWFEKWTQFLTSIFPELYMVYEWST